MHVAGQVIEGLLWFFIAFMWIRFVVDWVQVFARSWSPRGVLLVGLEVVYSVTDPPIKALRRVIPPLRIGNCRARPQHAARLHRRLCAAPGQPCHLLLTRPT